MDDNALGEFLRHRRERLRPEDVGLPGGGRRRTPGLRREEVATLAALSPDYYSRLEQGRVRTPSAAALAGLARAIRLTGDEQDYLFRLAGQQPPESRSPLAHVDPAMLYLLDELDRTPAQVADELLTVVAQNRAARHLLGVWTGLPGYRSNVTWRWFADPASRDANDPAEHELIGRAYAADLRAGLAHRPGGRSRRSPRRPSCCGTRWSASCTCSAGAAGHPDHADEPAELGGGDAAGRLPGRGDEPAGGGPEGRADPGRAGEVAARRGRGGPLRRRARRAQRPLPVLSGRPGSRAPGPRRRRQKSSSNVTEPVTPTW
ncbi:helix-turn-helix transcriptional regulator [Catenuloplanes indicus]|uniref:Transcriptional regulator with XRE-family HTH domain n=1 Tax=Catenuloplanes indicus TaxID=137267 RepID=A0AAE4AUH2_9ACTN|nr:helix-turn-helix transcriptional regulator [Catenuloplanes indicus]MDQ0363780.1 transcriptional regulator with XRE-family HTH domain [Catenuloplanes indicus]